MGGNPRATTVTCPLTCRSAPPVGLLLWHCPLCPGIAAPCGMLASQRAVLFLCTDITSHMLGLLPVVQELTARGIAVPTFIVANTSDITAEHTRLLEAAGAALLNAQHRFEVPPPPTVPSAAALLVGMLWRAQYTVPVVLAAVAAAQWVPGAVLYDHFAIEGFIVAKVLRLLGVVHLAVLRWAPMERAAYRAALRCDAFREANGRLAERHGVDVVRETGLGNFGHCGDLNFLWTSPALAGGLRWLHECLATWAPPGALTPPPTLDRFLFLGAAESPPLVAADPALEEALTAACARGQRVVLLAFGTLVMGQYYDAVGAAAREFFRDFFAALARAVAEARDLFVVVATGRTDPCDVFGRDAPPANLWHQRTVPQPQVESCSHVFLEVYCPFVCVAWGVSDTRD